MDYPGYTDANGRGSGFANKFNVDTKLIGQATAQIRAYIQTNIYDGPSNEIDRLTKYFLYWNFYEGNHYREWNDAMLSFNYVGAFINKVIMFLIGKDGFSLQAQTFDNEQVDKEIEDAVEKLLLYNWNKSLKRMLIWEILQMGSVCGDVWVGAEWQEEKKFVKIKLFDSRQCFPEFADGDTSNLSAFTIRIPLVREQNVNKFVVKVYRYTKEAITYWYQKDSLPPEKAVKYGEKSVENPYGIIPVVHIKNKPNGTNYFSRSDASDILKINKVYNETSQQQKSIIDYHTTPTTVITGATAKNLQRGLGKIWSGLPPEANVFNLGLDVDLGAMNEFMKTLKTNMHELGDVPENALGKIQAISNTSAAALAITYQPLIQQASLKEITYGEGIAEINTLVLIVHEKHDPKNKHLVALREKDPEFINNLKVLPVFAYGLPQDKQNDLNMGIQELAAKIATRREVMERLGKNNVPELLKEIDEEQINTAELQSQINEITMQEEMGQNTDVSAAPTAPDGNALKGAK